MIAEFNKRFAEEYKIKTAAALETVIEKRNAVNKYNAKTVRDRNTAADIAEAGTDGDDDDDQDNSEECVSENATEDEDEDEEGGGGKGTGSQFKRRQARSFDFTTGAVNRPSDVVEAARAKEFPRLVRMSRQYLVVCAASAVWVS